MDEVLITKTDVGTRNNRYTLDKLTFRKQIGRNWSTKRVVSEWKKLTESVVAAKTTVSLKR